MHEAMNAPIGMRQEAPMAMKACTCHDYMLPNIIFNRHREQTKIHEYTHMKNRRMHGNEGGRHTVEDLSFASAEAHVDIVSTCAVKETESVHDAIND